MLRKFFGVLIVLAGAYLAFTAERWGFWLIDLVGPERALGAQNVIREPDGTVLMTNPGAMMCYCLPFLAVGAALIIIGVVTIIGFKVFWRYFLWEK